ncbi:MAG: hypothetical protein CMJ18_07515 [Phycisphaeraceae bacterium]|nr:hypothetical protein [Phycisphaeraceae bacterium]
MLILRIRQAETAAADGRLDEAFELARFDDVRSHRRGQRLIGTLVRQFVERARNHCESEHFEQALADADKAARLGGPQFEIEQLRTEALDAVNAKRRSEGQRRETLDAARRHIDRGRLSQGERLLESLSEPGSRGRMLERAAADGRADRDRQRAQVRSAVEAGDFDRAVTALAGEGRGDDDDPASRQLRDDVVAGTLAHLRGEIEAGRIDRAATLLRRLDGLVPRAPVDRRSAEHVQIVRVIGLCARASDAIGQGRFDEARRALQRVAALMPDARWIEFSIEQARSAAEAREQLEVGPLGAMADGVTSVAGGSSAPVRDAAASPTVSPKRIVSPRGTELPSRMLMQIDGVGSFLILRDPQVTIGPASQSRPPTVPLMIRTDAASAQIERSDDDYFVRAVRDGESLRVNGRAVSNRLLADGDRIGLDAERRCSMKFRVPHAASTTAVVDLSGPRLSNADTRRIILLDRSLVIGPGPASHVRADALDAPWVLTVRDGALYAPGDSSALSPGAPIAVGELTARLTEW